MTLSEWGVLAAFKVRQLARRRWDRAAGSRLLERRAEQWASRWVAASPRTVTPLADWLRRPGGGEFWLSSDPAWFRLSCTPEDLEIAETTAAGVFDLLGSGGVNLGDPPRWRQDLYTGVEWPLTRSSDLRVVRGDGSDIRTVWEMSRGYHLLAFARAFATTGESRWADTYVRHLESWMDQNPQGFGPHWASPMDVAIRAANWIASLHGFAQVWAIPVTTWGRVLKNLYASGLFLERHLEWHPVYRGNHYVSNGVGLLYLGVMFRDTKDGERWIRKGSQILLEEMERQVGADGVSFESSLAYHRLVTEFFAYGGELMRLNLPGGLPPSYVGKLKKMYAFISAYLPEGGEAPMIGDADDGRLHAVSARGWLEPRRHALGLPTQYWPDEGPAPSAHPQGGFYVLRGGRNHAVVRCGAIGIRGAGSHDHNDQLSLELVLAGRRVLADSGTFAYTSDMEARHAFRSTRSHSVLQIAGEEQNPIRVDRPWRVLEDRTRARCLDWSVTGSEQRFSGEHHGFAHRAAGAICGRTVVLRPLDDTCRLVDEVSGSGWERVQWRLHFGPGELRHVRSEGELHRFLFPGDPPIAVTIRLPGSVQPTIVSGSASDSYGEKYLRPVLLAEGSVELPFTIETSFTVQN